MSTTTSTATTTTPAITTSTTTTTATEDTIRNLKPPTMITDPSQFPLYEKKMKRWSRLCPLSPQLQFDLILTEIPTSNPLNEKLEEEIGESTEAATTGVSVILDKLREWFGKEDIDAFVNYKEFEGKTQSHNQDLLQVMIVSEPQE